MYAPPSTISPIDHRHAPVLRVPGDAFDSVDRYMNEYLDGMSAAPVPPPAAEPTLSHPMARLDVGVTVAERYRLIEMLGHGGMGAVWKARDLRLGRIVALKTASLPNETDRRRFLREARLCSRIQHRNVVEIFDVGAIEDEIPYYTMELVEGRDLATVVRQGRQPLWAATILLRQIASALARVHQVGVIHRDIKPGNVVINESSSLTSNTALCKLVDFGLATPADGFGCDVSRITRTGHILGTPMYMSPEQLLGEPLDHASDIYSFGCLAYEVLTGAPPFGAGGLQATLHGHLHADPAPMFDDGDFRASPEVLAELEALVFRCLAKTPADRPGSMREVKHALCPIVRDLGFG